MNARSVLTRLFRSRSKLQPCHIVSRNMSTTQPSTLLTGALTGFADGSSYDKHRPSYRPEVVDCLLTNLGIANKKHAKVVDLAAGTGKFTELIAARPEGFELIAVEPHDGMRAELERKKLPGTQVRKGFADNVNQVVGEGWAESVICAQVIIFPSPKHTTALQSIPN